MDKFYIYGPTKLIGDVIISGSKNASLPILFASLLTEKPVKIYNVPQLKDIEITISILRKLGAKIFVNGSILIDTSTVTNFCAEDNLVKTIRASIWLLGPLLARFGKAKIFFPGGCNIGSRPIDLHINGLRQLGASIKLKENVIIASLNGRFNGTHIIMNKISVGATITLMFAATLANGVTIIVNAAREPEIVDTANFLISLGANIIGAGSKKIIISGVKNLNGGEYKILPDRIETATFLVAAASSRGNITCHDTCPKTLDIVLNKLREAGADIKTGNDWISLNMHGNRPKAIKLCTAPYPGFPTDMQSIFSLLNLLADGVGIITEKIFQKRFMHIPELIRMGACAKIQKNTVICYGVNNLIGTRVIATDLRASASLALAGCVANGKTIIDNINHIDRGYVSIEHKLRNIGACLERIKST